MKRTTLLVFFILLAGCRSQPTSPTVLDATWGKGWEADPESAYGGESSDSRAAENRPGGSGGPALPEEKIAYYKERLKTQDERGNPVPLVAQYEFDPVAEHQPERAKDVEEETKTPEDDLEFVGPDGSAVRLSSYRGRPVVLVFTRGFPGYVCPMCTTYTAQLASARARIAAAGAEVLLVFPGDQTRVDEFVAACHAILEEEGEGALPFPVLLDPELAAVDRFHLRADLSRPATYVLGPSGSVSYAYVGTMPHERPTVERILAEVEKATRKVE